MTSLKEYTGSFILIILSKSTGNFSWIGILESYNENKKITFAEYKEKMLEEQKVIYYASGKDKSAVERLPQMDLVKSKGFDVFILTDDIDEFMIQVLKEYDGVQFKSINQGDLDLIDDEEAKKLDELKETKKDLLENVKSALADVKDVIVSKRLVDSPCCLSSEGEISFEMERVLKQQNHDIKADRILELNPNHPVFNKLEEAYDFDKSLGDKYAKILYAQALLMEGILPENPQELSKDICELLLK